MDIRKISIQAIVGAILFTVISVVLEGSYGQEVWVEKGLLGILFGVVYAIFLVIKVKYLKK